MVAGGLYNVSFWYVTRGIVTYPNIPRTWLTWFGVPTLAMVGGRLLLAVVVLSLGHVSGGVRVWNLLPTVRVGDVYVAAIALGSLLLSHV